jgi:phosphate transport system permease protein
MRRFIDRASRYVVLLAASISFLILFAIAFFIIARGLPAIQEIGLVEFVTGTVWRPGQGQYGILPMIVGSVAATFGSLILAIPLGLGCAILLAEIAGRRARRFLRPVVELLVGIPSVVYGLVGMVLLVPLVRNLGGNGYSVLAASIVLMAMILPTVTSISEDSIRAVPRAYREASLAMGATQWQTIRHVLLPAARSGIGASIVLGMGRAVGETMAMLMVIGNSIKFPTSPLDSARTLTGNIALEINYASGLHEDALFATGIVLLAFIIILNTISFFALRRSRAQNIA